jgi:hypothetical protein
MSAHDEQAEGPDTDGAEQPGDGDPMTSATEEAAVLGASLPTSGEHNDRAIAVEAPRGTVVTTPTQGYASRGHILWAVKSLERRGVLRDYAKGRGRGHSR